MGPNLLLVVMDTARADAFQPYGAPPGSTPAVADLAKRGVAVPAAYATSNWTLPSHASMFTGRLPRQLGLGTGPAPAAVMRRQEDRMLASVLRSAGYDTRGVSANVWISRRHGFAAGFDRFVEVGGRRKHRARQGLRGRLRWAVDGLRATIDDGLAEAWSLIRSWIDESGRRPFFWFVNLMECHSPYLPPRPYNDLSVVERLRAAEDARIYQSHEGLVAVCLAGRAVPAASIERMRHLYGRAIRSMDDWLARVLDALGARGLLEDTFVVVTSDHGENLGEGHLLGHGFSLDDRLIRVPLVMAGPNAPAPSEAPFSLAGLPRLLTTSLQVDAGDRLGEVGAPSGVAIAQNDGFSGMSRDDVDRFARVWHLPPHAMERLRERMVCATDGRWKVVRAAGGERYYDLERDPLEGAPAAAPDDDVVRRLRAALELAGSGSDDVLPSTDASETEGIEDRLRLLGYL